jgi:hypothetical protein
MSRAQKQHHGAANTTIYKDYNLLGCDAKLQANNFKSLELMINQQSRNLAMTVVIPLEKYFKIHIYLYVLRKRTYVQGSLLQIKPLRN